jgi:hypothetical protein
MIRALLLFALLSASAASAQNLVVNPGFESPPGAGITTRYTCACEPPGFGWTVGGGGVDLVETYWPAEEGLQSLDLNADDQGPSTAPGSISQTIATTPNMLYLVSFMYSGNPDHSRAPDDGPALKQMKVTFGLDSYPVNFDVTGHTLANPGWAIGAFIAGTYSTSTELKFTSLTPGYAGILIDHVSVEAQPWLPARSRSWGSVKAGYR